jgi:anti-sigma B factor antagonist
VWLRTFRNHFLEDAMQFPVPFRVTIEPAEHACLIRPAGELEMWSAPVLRRELDDAREVERPVLLDLSEVTFIDSTGLEVLLDMSLESAAGDWAFFIVRPSEPVLRLIELSGTADRLTLVDSAVDRATGR